MIVSHHPVIFFPAETPGHREYPPTVWPGRGSPRSVSIPISTGRPAGSATFSPFAWSWTIYKPRPTASAGSGARRSPGPHGDFAAFVGKRLGTPVRLRAGTGPVKRVAVCGGAGGDFLLPLLKEGGADTAVTGELKHHEWLALPPGVTVVEAGHYHTEACMTEGWPAGCVRPFHRPRSRLLKTSRRMLRSDPVRIPG